MSQVYKSHARVELADGLKASLHLYVHLVLCRGQDIKIVPIMVGSLTAERSGKLRFVHVATVQYAVH